MRDGFAALDIARPDNTVQTRMWADAERDGRPVPENVYIIYSVPAQETAKHRAKFAWPAVSDVAAVRKPRRETR